MIALMTVALTGCGSQSDEKLVAQPEPAATPVDRPTEPSVQPARVSADTQKPEKEPEGDQPDEPAAVEKPAATPEEKLNAALKAKNPGFEGPVQVGHEGRIITAVALNDPAIKDISPLAQLPLFHLDLTGCGVTDISALKGLPLRILYLGETGVRDLGPLQGMPLEELHLSDTQVENLSPLKGAEGLQKLNLIGSRVSDLGPLRGMPALNTLWLTRCPVSDLSPLSDVPSLVSLTIAETKVSDLSPLRGLRLVRLHIAKTDVTDLSVLQSLRLERLIFTPGKIKTGIEFARNMSSLRQIDVRFDDEHTRPTSPPAFWARYDAGEFK